MESLKRSSVRIRGQTLVEFTLVLPLILLVLFMIVEIGRLLHAWIAIENGARFAMRYAVTGEYSAAHFDDSICNNFYADFGDSCDTEVKKENAARILSIMDAANAGAAAIMRDDAETWDHAGFVNFSICSTRNVPGFTYFPSDPDNWATDWSSDCAPYHDAGGPGDRVVVTMDFNHPLIVPFLSSYWPMLHLTASREGRVEQFRVSRVVGIDPTLVLPTPTPLPTNTPTITPTPSQTHTPTSTACKVPPIVQIIEPAGGEVYSVANPLLPGEAEAYDPDNSYPDTCSGAFGPNGNGIQEVRFIYQFFNGSSWVTVHSQTERVVAYCGFGGNSPCATYDVSGLTWSSGTLIESGLHRLLAGALDDEGVWSAWDMVEFYIEAQPTPTPTMTPTPDCSNIYSNGIRLNGDDFEVRVRNNNPSTAYLIDSTIVWNTTYAPPMFLNFIQFNGNRYWNPAERIYTSPITAAAPSVALASSTSRWWEADFNLNSQPFMGFYSATLVFDYPGWGTCTVSRSLNFIPTVTPTPSQTFTATASATWGPPPPTYTPRPTRTPTRTLPPSRTPTITRTPSRTPTMAATWTEAATATPVHTAMPTDPPVPTDTQPPTPTQTPPSFEF